MKWKRLGKIFDPTEHALPAGCSQFAQSPQALVFGDFVRVYFSTRAVEPSTGKYFSHVAFVDFRKSLREVLRVSSGAVISLGKLGCFDEHGIFPMNVLRHGGRIYGYTSGWSRRVSVSVETAIGLVFSDDDGLTFHRTWDGPVMASSLQEACLVGDPFVKVIDGVFHMWYIFGRGWKRFSPDSEPDRIYKIGHAVSSDGVEWAREEGRPILPDQLGPDESQALPAVMRYRDQYYMVFCYRQSHDFRSNPERGYRLGHAVSSDLVHWRRLESSVLPSSAPGEWDADMQCYPHVFECDGGHYLLYNGNNFGRRGFGLAVLEA